MFDLKRFRKEQKLTQGDISKHLGLSRSYISNIERGAERISDTFLDKIHQAFGVEIEHFKSYNQRKDAAVIKEDDPNLIDKLQRLEGKLASMQASLDQAAEERLMTAKNELVLLRLLQQTLAAVEHIPVEKVVEMTNKISADVQP